MLKEGLLSRRKIIPGRNMDIHKGMKNTRNGNYLSKYDFFSYYLNLFKREVTSKTKIIIYVELITHIKVKCMTTIIQGPRWKYTIERFL